MSAIALFLVSAFASWSSMAALCFQSPSQRHRMGMRIQSRAARAGLVSAASALLALSLLAATRAYGMSFGILLSVCLTGVLGFALVCVLPYSVSRVANTSLALAVSAPALFAAIEWL